MTHALKSISFVLLLLLSIFAHAQTTHSGIFASTTDTLVLNEMGSDYLSFFNTHNGRIGTLRKVNDSSYLLGLSNKKPDSLNTHTAARINFSADGRHLIFNDIIGQQLSYNKLYYTERILSIPVSNGAVLQAKLVMPHTGHKVPLIIIGHGSELLGKDFYKEAYLFASWGAATLVFDKRGVGQSTGEANPDIFVQAEDIAAAARMAATLPEVDTTKIGLWGFSQGGWVAPLALIHEPALKFAVILSGAATTAFEEEIAGIVKSLQFYRYSQPEIDKATDLLSEIYLTIQYTENWPNLDVLKEKYKEEPWYPVLIKQSLICSYFLGPQAPYVKAHTKELLASTTYTHWCFYDPYRYISRVQVPVLWIYGSEDKSIPAEKSMQILEEIRSRYHSRFEFHMLMGVNHAGYIDEHIGIEDYGQVKFVSKVYLILMKQWLKQNKVL